MKKKSLRLVAGTLAISAAIASAGTAHAEGSLGEQDATAYAQELSDHAAFQWAPGNARGMAMGVCQDLARGTSESQVENGFRRGFNEQVFGDAWTVIVPGGGVPLLPVLLPHVVSR